MKRHCREVFCPSSIIEHLVNIIYYSTTLDTPIIGIFINFFRVKKSAFSRVCRFRISTRIIHMSCVKRRILYCTWTFWAQYEIYLWKSAFTITSGWTWRILWSRRGVSSARRRYETRNPFRRLIPILFHWAWLSWTRVLLLWHSIFQRGKSNHYPSRRHYQRTAMRKQSSLSICF